jgi:hypothetical protein
MAKFKVGDRVTEKGHLSKGTIISTKNGFNKNQYEIRFDNGRTDYYMANKLTLYPILTPETK